MGRSGLPICRRFPDYSRKVSICMNRDFELFTMDGGLTSAEQGGRVFFYARTSQEPSSQWGSSGDCCCPMGLGVSELDPRFSGMDRRRRI